MERKWAKQKEAFGDRGLRRAQTVQELQNE